MLLQNLLQRSVDTLIKAGIDNPHLDARLLVAHALLCGRLDLVTQGKRALTQDETTAIQNLVDRRVKREPVARILGLREFWGLPFGLNEATLEPRPDSETLVEDVLAQCSRPRHPGESRDPSPASSNKASSGNHAPVGNDRRWIPAFAGMTLEERTGLKILDLGTGTGCLLLSLLHELPEATGVGIDIAPRAVEQARANAQRLGLYDRAEFRVGNWLENLTGAFDIIVSNPPYIASGDIPSLMPEVREHDPVAALDGGKDGLDVYRLLIPQLFRFLNSGGLVAFEVGQGQAETVSALLRSANFTAVTTRLDLGGIVRCVMGMKN